MRASRRLILVLSTAERRAAEARQHVRDLRAQRADTASILQAGGIAEGWEQAVEMVKAMQ